MKTKIINGQVITPFRIIPNGTVLIQDRKIISVAAGVMDTKTDITIDASGKYVSPGFIDMHVHGGGGHSFMDATVEAFIGVAACHAAFGTTLMSPTTLSCSESDLLEVVACFEEARELKYNGARFTGLHLEGPYINPLQCGAQDPRYIRNPLPAEYKKILSHPGLVSRWSAAPELKGGMQFGRYLKSSSVIAAIAHTDAIYEEALEAFENGYSLLTHFYSAMSGVTRRNTFRVAGVIESGYLIDEMDLEIIADGAHLPTALLQLVHKIKGPSKAALVTDAMRAAGMGPGESILGSKKDGLKVIVEDGVAKLPDRSGFAGSVATTDRLVRTMVHQAGVPLLDAVQMMTSTPARILKLAERTGSLTIGKDADIVIFDSDIQVERTIVSGETVYVKPMEA